MSRDKFIIYHFISSNYALRITPGALRHGFYIYKIKNNNILVLCNFVLFSKKLLNSDKLKLCYNDSILNTAVDMLKINNNFLNINIGDNSIKPASF